MLPLWEEVRFENQVLYIDSIVDSDSCLYSLKSGYLDNVYLNLLLLREKDVYVKMSPTASEYQLLFTQGQKGMGPNLIDVYHADWGGEGGQKFVSTTYKVRLLNSFTDQGELFSLISIDDLITAFPEVGVLDAVLVFSSFRGFIGSYFCDEQYPKTIIEKRGNILENQIDYEGYEFRVIM